MGVDGQYPADPQRFRILFLFSSIAFLWAGSWLAFAPIADVVGERFDVGPGAVNMFATTYAVLYIPSSLLGMVVTETYGLHVTLSASGTVNALSCLIRWAVLATDALSPHAQYGVNMAAQVVAGIFQAMCLNLPARLAMDWFPAEERDLATTAASMANVLGQMVFSLLAPLLVHTPEQLDRIMFVQWVPAILVAAGCWVFLKAKPRVAPSPSAAIQWRETAAIASRARKNSGGDVIRAAFETIWKDVSLLLSNANFMLLSAGFSAGTGMVWAVLILEGQLITPCGFSDAFSGTAGAALLATGIVSAFIIGGVMEATKAYLELQRGVMIAAFVATVGVLAATRPAYPAMLLLAYCLLGAALQPLMPVTLEHAAEMTFPVPADASTSVLFMMANSFSAFLVLVITPLLSLEHKCSTVFTPTAALILIIMAAGLASTLSVQRDYRRSSAEHPEGKGDGNGGGGNGGIHRTDSPVSSLLGTGGKASGSAAAAPSAYGAA